MHLSDSNVSAIIGGIIGITGSVIVFAMTALRERKQAENERNRNVKNVHALIRLEIAHNVSALKARWEQVTQHTDALPEGDDVLKQARFLKEPFPVWNTLMWERLAANLPDAFTEQQINDISDLHAQAKMLAIARSMLTPPPDERIRLYENWKAETPEHQYAKQADVRALLWGYLSDTRAQWEECRARVVSILSIADSLALL